MVLPWFYHGFTMVYHVFPMVFIVFSWCFLTQATNLRNSAGWIQEMTADGDTTRRLCDELAKQMGELISQAAQLAKAEFSHGKWWYSFWI